MQRQLQSESPAGLPHVAAVAHFERDVPLHALGPEHGASCVEHTGPGGLAHRDHPAERPQQADELVRLRAQLESVLSEHTGQSVETLRADTDRDRIFTAQAALDYGLVDQILTDR